MLYFTISFVLELLLSIFISSTYQDINMFFPCILLASFPISYIITKNKKFFWIFIVVFGIICDLLFSDIFLINVYYFLLYSFFIYIYYEQHSYNIFNIFFISVLGICFYDIFIFFTLILTNYAVFNIDELFYKIKNAILLNSIYVIVSILSLKSRIFGLKISKKRYY